MTNNEKFHFMAFRNELYVYILQNEKESEWQENRVRTLGRIAPQRDIDYTVHRVCLCSRLSLGAWFSGSQMWQ